MCLLRRDQRLQVGACTCKLLLPLLTALLLTPAVTAKTGTLSGIVFTVGQDHVQIVWPNARVTLKNLTMHSEVSSVSNDAGVYTFAGVAVGDYEVSVALAGFETITKPQTIREGPASRLDFQLILRKQIETVTVRAEPGGVDLSSSFGGSPVLTADILKSAVRLGQDFQEALPLLPGVVRGPDGLIRIKGGRTNQTSTLVNTASVADPFTGQPALRLPVVAVQSVRVLSNPFSSEYGKFSSGVVEVNTRGGTDDWKWLFEDPIPRFRWIDYRTHGVESASPHLTFAGPIKRGRLYLFQSLAYGYDTVRTPSLPDPNNVRVVESVTTYTQLDWNLKPNQQFSVSLTTDPQDTDFANINTFNSQPVTADYHQRGFFTSATHRWILASGGFLQSMFAAKRLDAQVFPARDVAGEMVLFPEQNWGSFFQQQDRRTRLYQWSQTLHLRPLQSAGRHLLTFGYSYARSTYQGQVGNLPVNVLREDGTVSSQITYDPPLASQATKNELSFFVQDNWQIRPRFTVDLGARFDHDSLSAEALNVAPRVGFVFAPTRDNRTAIRGGFGVFFDKIPINVSVFRDFPAQTIARYASDGITIIDSPAKFTHVVVTADGRLRVPYSLGWSVQFDRELRTGLLFRFGYEGRKVHREFYVDPLQLVDRAQLRLFNSGGQTYREFLWMLRWRPRERTTLFASYVNSRARGDLNDYNQFFGNIPYPLIRPNQYGIMPSDAPNRGLIWGVVGLPHKLDFIPVLDVHTGFPFSKLDENWNYIGRENEAGRFRTFVGLDMKIQYPFDFKFHRRRFQFRAGLSVLNVLNYSNPRDVQQYTGSPHYGNFYNSIGRLFRIDGDFDF
jgi:Carboxypeptidase regulatory-like domain/TonB dependent receptor-like, beta-barrel